MFFWVHLISLFLDYFIAIPHNLAQLQDCMMQWGVIFWNILFSSFGCSFTFFQPWTALGLLFTMGNVLAPNAHRKQSRGSARHATTSLNGSSLAASLPTLLSPLSVKAGGHAAIIKMRYNRVFWSLVMNRTVPMTRQLRCCIPVYNFKQSLEITSYIQPVNFAWCNNPL